MRYKEVRRKKSERQEKERGEIRNMDRKTRKNIPDRRVSQWRKIISKKEKNNRRNSQRNQFQNL